MKPTDILIVDDNPDNKLTIELLLEDFDNVAIESAENGQEAVEMCRNKHYDLIFMDLMMPVMDGIEATKQIREFDKKAMIIAVTALDDDKSKERMILYGAEDFVIKPIQSALFTKRVQNYLEILGHREQQSYDNEAVNLFDKNVYNRSTVLRVFDLPSLGEFWEYFLASEHKSAYGMSEGVRILYAFGAWLVKNGKRFSYVSEENDDYLFITQFGLDSISENVMRHLLLKHYPSGTYQIQDGVLTVRLPKVGERAEAPAAKEEMTISSEKKEVLRKTHENKIPAWEFVEMSAVSLLDKIDALEEIEDKVDQALFEMEKISPDPKAFASLAEDLETYNEVIDAMIEFQHLAFAIASLIKFLKNLKAEDLQGGNDKKMVMMLTNMLADLASWRKTIFVQQEANDIHYLDSSLLSSCLQIEMILNDQNLEGEDEEGFELF